MSPAAPQRVQDLMTGKVITVGPEASVLEVVSKLHGYRISCVVVCEYGTPVGIISERDVVGFTYDFLRGDAQARVQAIDLMASPVHTVRRSDAIEQAIALAKEHRVRHLPVVDDDAVLVGLLTQTDLVHWPSRDVPPEPSPSAPQKSDFPRDRTRRVSRR